MAKKAVKRITIGREIAWLINGFGFVVIYESARKTELLIDAETGKPFTSREEANAVAEAIVNEPYAIEARAVEVKPVGCYSSVPS
jgi:hypothetical protein